MSRKQSNNSKKGQSGNNYRGAQPKQTQVTKSKTNIMEAVENIASVAMEKATVENIEGIGEVSIPSNITIDELQNALKKAIEARRLFEVQLAGLAKREIAVINGEENLRQARERLSEETDALQGDQEELKSEKALLAESNQEIEARCKELDQRNADLSLRELNAKAGFLEQYKEVYDQASRQLESYHNELSQIVALIYEQRVKGLQELEEEFARMRHTEQEHITSLREQHNQQISSEREHLEQERQQVIQERSELIVERGRIERERIYLDADKAIFSEDQENLEERVKALVERNTERIQAERDWWKDQDLTANKELNRLRQLLSAWDSLSKTLGKDPDVILSERNELIDRIRDLENQLKNSPTEKDLERLKELETLRQDWENERYSMGRELEELRVKLSKARLSVVEHENLRDENIALEASRNLLRKEIDELREDIDGRLEDDSSQSPFPQCYSFDLDPDLQTAVEADDITNLAELVSDVQKRIARKKLFYSERDIRSFLGGLAMSRMMILQGISGTGKTSLPIEFAEALGAGSEVIEVQAGWRDRDDLLGYYNSFEKKYYEKKFLQALYRAQCPAFRDRLFIILLDEVNLSYVEQYFADLLSVLQMRKQSDHKIDLVPHILPNRVYPRGFVNNSRSIQVSPNVWFIGTANRDETTKDIADKTYDRAHIIELPERHPPAFEPGNADSSPANISYRKLTDAFKKARENDSYKKDLDLADKFFTEVRPFMNRRFGIGFGSRLEKQMELYLPIIRSSGGTWAEAIDDIFAMRVLRKIRDRYEIQYSDLEDLLKQIEDAWKKIAGKAEFTSGLSTSIRIIEEEKNKKRNRQAEEQSL